MKENKIPQKSLVLLMALALAACAPASVTPAPTQAPTREAAPAQAPSPAPAQPTATPSGAEVEVLPTWTPAPTDIPIAPSPIACPDLRHLHSEITLAPIPNAGDLIAIANADGLYVFDLKTGVTTLVFDNWVAGSVAVEQPFWSPDGKKLALVRASPINSCPASQLILADTEKRVARMMSSFDTRIQIMGWTKDGRLLFWTGDDLLAADTVGGAGIKPYDLRNAPPETLKKWFTQGRAISSDLTHLAFVPSLTLGRQTTLHIVNLSTGIEQTADVPVEALEYIQWSPNNRYILAKGGLAGVFLVDTQNNNQVRQLDFYALPLRNAWSADGSRIAFILAEDGGLELPKLGIYTLKTGQMKTYPMGFMKLIDGAWRK